MPSYSARQTLMIAATPQACFDALTDYERLPEWQRGLRATTVVEADARSAVVEYELDAKIKTVRYRLRLTYDEPEAIDSEYLSGDLKRLEAGWQFKQVDAGTEVTLAIDLDPGLFIPGPVRKVVQDVAMRGAMRDLRRFVES